VPSDEYGWPSKSCRFPAWLTNITWHDFEGRRVYSVGDDVIYEMVAKNPGSARRQMQAEMKCVQFARSTSNEFTAHSFVIYGWSVSNKINASDGQKLTKKLLTNSLTIFLVRSLV